MNTLLSIVGTTGIGKTKLAIELAKHFDTEIISCDSRQFFKQMPIGTAAPTPEELSEVRHHFIGNLSVRADYSIGQFELDALRRLKQIFVRKPIVIMVGGSMMYEKAVITGLNDLPQADESNQILLDKIWREEGLNALQDMLKSLDYEYWKSVDLQNPRRLLRAIDVIWQTGQKFSTLINSPKHPRDFRTIRIGIEAPREIIYERINTRVDEMINSGLLSEVERLRDFQHLVPLKTVGYTELFKYLNGEWDLDFAISEIKKNSRRFAKRQLTWYRKEQDIHWVHFEKAFEESLKILEHNE